MDPDNLILTTVGADYIRAQIAAGQPCRIGGFKLADQTAFVPDETFTEIPGNITYVGNLSEVFYTKYNEQEVIVRFCVESDKGDFRIGNAGIYSDTGVLLFLARFDYNHLKMKSITSSPGGRWTYQVRLTMDDLFAKWSFDNLTAKYASSNTRVLGDAEQYPFDSFYTEMHLNEAITPTNRSGYFNLSQGTSRFWASSPFQIQYNDLDINGRYTWNGGETGDSHEYLA